MVFNYGCPLRGKVMVVFMGVCADYEIVKDGNFDDKLEAPEKLKILWKINILFDKLNIFA